MQRSICSIILVLVLFLNLIIMNTHIVYPFWLLAIDVSCIIHHFTHSRISLELFELFSRFPDCLPDNHARNLYIYYIWDSFRENCASYIYIKCYKNASRLNRYIFRTVNAIHFLLSALHTTPFPYDKIHFGVLHLLHASIATFDTPPGSNPP